MHSSLAPLHDRGRMPTSLKGAQDVPISAGDMELYAQALCDMRQRVPQWASKMEEQRKVSTLEEVMRIERSSSSSSVAGLSSMAGLSQQVVELGSAEGALMLQEASSLARGNEELGMGRTQRMDESSRSSSVASYTYAEQLSSRARSGPSIILSSGAAAQAKAHSMSHWPSTPR